MYGLNRKYIQVRNSEVIMDIKIQDLRLALVCLTVAAEGGQRHIGTLGRG